MHDEDPSTIYKKVTVIVHGPFATIVAALGLALSNAASPKNWPVQISLKVTFCDFAEL